MNEEIEQEEIVRFWHKDGLTSYYDLPEEFELEVGVYKTKTLITKEVFIDALQQLISSVNFNAKDIDSTNETQTC